MVGERGRVCVFLGYPMVLKGYKLYDLKILKMHTTRDVTFVENVFPFDDNYNGHKVIDRNTIVESINSVENFVNSYDLVIEVEPTIGADENVPRREVEIQDDKGQYQLNKARVLELNQDISIASSPICMLPLIPQSQKIPTTWVHLNLIIYLNMLIITNYLSLIVHILLLSLPLLNLKTSHKHIKI